MAVALQPMEPGGVWLQPNSTNVPPTYVTHQAHITRLTLDGWHPVPDPRTDLLAQQQAEDEQRQAQAREQAEREEAQAKRIADLEALVSKLLATHAAPQEEPVVTDEAKDESKRPTRRAKVE